ncbi:DNA alkylation repair protein [Candidatus Microgenomates bacterium]|nr:MAG: DNA alkylation repair protein [Candidatus Microgenomates bacterium]
MALKKLEEDLLKAKNLQKAKFLARFFKTGKGEYAEGDIFLGITVPIQREIAKKYTSLSFDDLQKLLFSKIHEQRLVSLLILISKYKKANEKEKEKIYKFYLKNAKNINNWDLVDLSSHLILGDYLLEKDKEILYKLAKSDNLWEKRIAVISTYYFIKNNCFKECLKISEILLTDKHDLIHKAVGWMLREIGKKDQKIEEEFLNKHYKKMPRTMLRYAIERFGEEKRKFYLSK